MRALSEKERESMDECVAQESAGLRYPGGRSDCLLPSGEGRRRFLGEPPRQHAA